MKIVIAPDSFKESLSAAEVAENIRTGLLHALPDADIVMLPLADGGEGTAQVLCQALHGMWHTVESVNALGHPISARYAVANIDGAPTAIIEMADTAGLEHISPEQRDPLRSSTYGTGRVILDALERGITHFIMGIGGSATSDGGRGVLMALGARFYDTQGQLIAPHPEALENLTHVDMTQMDSRLQQCTFTIACDVDNPLLGTHGASHIFAKQKGATDEDIIRLEAILTNYAKVLEKAGFPADPTSKGAGAAGGLGFALSGLPHAQMKAGTDIVLSCLGIAEHIADANIVITGEGKLDNQTLAGKVPLGVLLLAQQTNTPVIAICGALEADTQMLHDAGFYAAFSCVNTLDTLDNTLKKAPENLQHIARQIGQCLTLGTAIHKP